jgi:hypothetical protein
MMHRGTDDLIYTNLSENSGSAHLQISLLPKKLYLSSKKVIVRINVS